jgi:hypothetical protein
MKKVYLLITGILLTFSFSLFAQTTASTSDSVVDKDIYKLIVTGKENEIKDYFKDVTLEVLTRSDNGAIVRGINRLNSNNKVTHTIWILGGVKNSSIDVRRYVYTELEKIEFGKYPYVIKTLVNNFFFNFDEKEVTLTEKVSKIQKKMTK